MKQPPHKKLLFLILVGAVVMACRFGSTPTLTPVGDNTPDSSSIEVVPTEIVSTEPVVEETTNFQSSLTALPGYTPLPIPSKLISDEPKSVIELGRWGKEPWGATVEFFPDGKTIAIDADGGISYYDTGTYEEKQFISTPKPVWAIALSPDGKYIAVTVVNIDTYLEIEIFDATTGKMVSDLGRGNNPTYSPNSQQLAVPSSDGVNVFTADGSQLLYTINVSSSPVAYSYDSRYIATSEDNSIHIYNVDSGELIQKMEGHTDYLYDASFSPDGSQLATGSKDGTVIVWDVNSGQLLHTFDHYGGRYFSRATDTISYSPDGSQLTITASDDIEVWDSSSFEPINTFALGGYATNINFDYSPDGKQLVSVANDGTIIFWDIQSRKPKHTLESVTKLSFLPNGKLFDISYDDAIRLWDPITGNLLVRLNSGKSGYQGEIDEVRYSPDSSQIASIFRDDTIQVWDANTGDILYTFEKQDGKVKDIVYISDGWQVIIDKSGVIETWDLEANQIIPNAETEQTDATKVVDARFEQYSPDGKIIARHIEMNTASSPIDLIDANTGTSLIRLDDTGLAEIVGFSPDGKYLITEYSFGIFQIWGVP